VALWWWCFGQSWGRPNGEGEAVPDGRRLLAVLGWTGEAIVVQGCFCNNAQWRREVLNIKIRFNVGCESERAGLTGAPKAREHRIQSLYYYYCMDNG
jgi:hypothetical protein